VLSFDVHSKCILMILRDKTCSHFPSTSRVRNPIWDGKKLCAFSVQLWQVALHHVATVHLAVNGYLAHRTAIKIVRMISHQCLEWQLLWLYAYMRVEIEFE